MWYFTLKYMNWRNLLQLENNMNEKMLTVLTERAAEVEHGFRGPSETDACSRNTQHLWLWVCLQSHLIVLNKPYPPDFCSAGYVPKHVARCSPSEGFDMIIHTCKEHTVLLGSNVLQWIFEVIDNSRALYWVNVWTFALFFGGGGGGLQFLHLQFSL